MILTLLQMFRIRILSVEYLYHRVLSPLLMYSRNECGCHRYRLILRMSHFRNECGCHRYRLILRMSHFRNECGCHRYRLILRISHSRNECGCHRYRLILRISHSRNECGCHRYRLILRISHSRFHSDTAYIFHSEYAQAISFISQLNIIAVSLVD